MNSPKVGRPRKSYPVDIIPPVLTPNGKPLGRPRKSQSVQEIVERRRMRQKERYERLKQEKKAVAIIDYCLNCQAHHISY